MRNIEQCKAEVFRRSEERLEKRRKNVRHILTMSVPLCLLIVLLALPAPGRKKGDRGAEDKVVSYISAEIQGVKTETDPEIVEMQFQKIESLFEEKEFQNVEEDENVGYSWVLQRSYRILFTANTGEQCAYVLEGNLLSSEETGVTVTLGDSQIRQLLTLFELE